MYVSAPVVLQRSTVQRVVHVAFYSPYTMVCIVMILIMCAIGVHDGLEMEKDERPCLIGQKVLDMFASQT